MQPIKENVKTKGVLVSTSDLSLAVKLGTVVDLSSIVNGKRALCEFVDNHTVICVNNNIYEIA